MDPLPSKKSMEEMREKGGGSCIQRKKSSEVVSNEKVTKKKLEDETLSIGEEEEEEEEEEGGESKKQPNDSLEPVTESLEQSGREVETKEGVSEGKKEGSKEVKVGSKQKGNPLARSASPSLFTSPLSPPPPPPSPVYFVGKRSDGKVGEGWASGDLGARELPLCRVGRAYDSAMSFDLRNSLVFDFI